MSGCDRLIPDHDYEPVGKRTEHGPNRYRCADCEREITIEVVPFDTRPYGGDRERALDERDELPEDEAGVG